MYTIDELVKVARKTGKQSPVLVEAALHSAGKKKYSLEEAERIIKKFAGAEVKN